MNTCKTCEWWKCNPEFFEWGSCPKLEEELDCEVEEETIHKGPRFGCPSDFGCIHHEPKEE